MLDQLAEDKSSEMYKKCAHTDAHPQSNSLHQVLQHPLSPAVCSISL